MVLKKLPAPPDNNPIVGNILHLHTSRDNVFKKLREWERQCYSIYNIRVLHINAACLVGDFERILSNPKTHREKYRLRSPR
ncbi:hypothetical protein MTP99_016433 [Tenebrio molitor]|nr:hypothetical protein MTP99_016433 [Tenebrio molitor]